MEISNSSNPHYAKVDEQGFLMVCLCEKTCNHHASLQNLLDSGYGVLLHIHDKDGNIIPLTSEDLK